MAQLAASLYYRLDARTKTNRSLSGISPNVMKVLLGDDHQLFVEGITAILRTHQSSITIQCVYQGADVLHETLTNDYDLVLLDIRLPELNGFDVLEKLQQRLILTPVIVLSASENPADMKQAASLGARALHHSP